MNEYYINVSLNGKFFFRTDWDDDKERVETAAIMIKSSMILCDVTLYTKSKLMTSRKVI